MEVIGWKWKNCIIQELYKSLFFQQNPYCFNKSLRFRHQFFYIFITRIDEIVIIATVSTPRYFHGSTALS